MKHFHIIRCFYAVLVLYIDLVLSKDLLDLAATGEVNSNVDTEAEHQVLKRSSAFKRLPGWSVYYGKRSGDNIFDGDLRSELTKSSESETGFLDSDVIKSKLLADRGQYVQGDSEGTDDLPFDKQRQQPWVMTYSGQDSASTDSLDSGLSMVEPDDESVSGDADKRQAGWNDGYGKRRPGWQVMYGKRAPQWMATYGKRAPQWMATYGKRAPQWMATYGKRAPQWMATYGKRAPQWMATYGKRAPQWMATYGKRAPQWMATYGKRAPQWMATYGKRAPQWMATYGKRAPQWLATYGKRLPGWAITYGKRAPQWLTTYGKRAFNWQAVYGKRDSSMATDDASADSNDLAIFPASSSETDFSKRVPNWGVTYGKRESE